MTKRGKYVPWKPRRVEFEMTTGKRAGNSLEDVLRDLVVKARDDLGMNQKDFAKNLGISQSALSRFESDAPNQSGNSEQLKSSALTRICVLLDENPVNFLIEHPLYDGATRARMTFPKDHLYRRYNAQLKNAEALGLLPNLKRAKDLGVFEQAVAAVANVVEAAEESRATMPPLQPRPGPRDSHRSPRSSQTRRSS